MTWGPYWMYYQCKKCGKKYRYELDIMSDDDTFGKCPACGGDGALKAETKDFPSDADDYEVV